MSRVLYRLTRRSPYRVVALATLIGFCLGVFPIPLAVPEGLKDTSTPFPCQHCACGCKTAEQCWKRCCCFTPAEKLAWAVRNHVTPPAYAEKPRVEVASTVTGSKVKACCQKNTTAKCDSTSNNTCGDRSCGRSTTRFVLSIQAMKCQGLTLSFTSVPAFVIDWQNQPVNEIELLFPLDPLENLSPVDLDEAPPSPPPRRV